MAAGMFSDGLLPIGQPSFAFFERLGKGQGKCLLSEQTLGGSIVFFVRERVAVMAVLLLYNFFGNLPKW